MSVHTSNDAVPGDDAATCPSPIRYDGWRGTMTAVPATSSAISESCTTVFMVNTDFKLISKLISNLRSKSDEERILDLPGVGIEQYKVT